jgi:putative flippase GtrA
MNRIARFVAVGGAGFLVDAGVLALLLWATPLDPFTARIGSIAVALVATWQLNRHLTFGASSRSIAVEGARYGGVGITTSVINYCAYALAIWAVPAMPPLLALAFGSAMATVFSYLGYSRLVFDR